jgi:hypothetical protein
MKAVTARVRAANHESPQMISETQFVDLPESAGQLLERIREQQNAAAADRGAGSHLRSDLR